MNVIRHAGPMELIAIGLGPGEKLLESIRQALGDCQIRNGVVVSGVGTLKTCRLHYVTHTGFPPQNAYFTLAKPLELLSVSGLIADGRPHLHVVVSCGDKEVYAGHLEDESEVLYLAELAVLKCNGLEMTRRADAQRGISLLGPST